MNRALWIAQGLLAAVFAFAGGSKLITPPEILAMMSPFPVAFVQFIGVCEVLGPLGLILPLALKIRPELTTLAALGLTVIMVATQSTLVMGAGVPALMQFVILVLTVGVAYGRRNLLAIPHLGALRVRPAWSLPPRPLCP